MLSVIQKSVLYLHIFAGFTALLTGIIPMVSKKGDKLHVRAGKVYVWAMFMVAFSAVFLYFIQTHSDFRLFLMFIGIFSFYQTYTGVRAIKQKQSGFEVSVIDKILAVVILLCGLVMTGLSGMHFWQFAQGNSGALLLGILFGVFGLFCLTLGRQDWLNTKNQVTETEKMHWFFRHMTRMLGAYIATFTAFCVVNGGRMGIPPLVVWLLPGFLGGFGIRSWVKYYKQKFAVKKSSNVI
jgi:uncharacterized membrane protein